MLASVPTNESRVREAEKVKAEAFLMRLNLPGQNSRAIEMDITGEGWDRLVCNYWR